jgi:hypothetical protein
LTIRSSKFQSCAAIGLDRSFTDKISIYKTAKHCAGGKRRIFNFTFKFAVSVSIKLIFRKAMWVYRTRW